MATNPVWRLDRQGIRLVFAYSLRPGVDSEEFERWLYAIHIPDLLENPYITRLVLNRVIAGPDGEPGRYYRTAEQHFVDEEAYRRSLDWRREHPVPAARAADPLIEIDFRAVCSGEEVDCEAARTAAANMAKGAAGSPRLAGSR
jgi:hypothetical protein